VSLVDWPADALKLVRSLANLPARAVFAGRCVREALSGRVPSDLEILTDAPAAGVLALFPQAVVVGPARATLSGPQSRIDVVSLEAGLGLEEALARRDLSVNAMAVDPFAKELIDPFEGRADLEAQRIRPTRAGPLGDPLCVLRACRLVSREGFEATPELVSAMTPAAGRIREVARARIRVELVAMLLGERVEAGLDLLRACGLEAQLAPDTESIAARWVSLLPPDLPLRLTAWLKAARTIRVLRRLRFPRSQVDRVELLLRNHPLEGQATTGQSRRRLARRPSKLTHDLFELRRGEIEARGEGPAALRLLEETRDGIEEFRRAERAALERPPLALDGRAVMQHLGCRPGPKIGRALAFLEAAVAAAPESNTPEALRAALDRWEDA
jgi:tRNA nucleotidyltransferase/poly(A) polymerase